MKAARRLVAVAQLNQSTNVETNYQKIAAFAQTAAGHGAQMLCLPENCNFFGHGVLAAAQPITGEYVRRYQQLARDTGLWISLGSIQESTALPKKYHNSHILLSSSGDVAAVYRKLHLFDVQVSATNKFSESDAVEAGKTIPPPVQTPIGKVALTICYDLRFPELYRKLALMGAEVVLVPSAFLEKTGYAHWEPLLRARAIENQCYIIASAQDGVHSSTRTNYGHSCVVDPWGNILCTASEGERLIYADIDLSYLEDVRRRIPCLQHRRSDLY